MTKQKKISQTLTNIIDNKIMQEILDKSNFISDQTINQVLDFWNFDLYSMTPGVAYTLGPDGPTKHTTLDLATFMYALTERNAVINIPEYKSRRETRLSKNQVVLSKNNRHGQCLAMTSNQEVFSFGVRIKDSNVMVNHRNNNQTVGAYRTFLLTDINGSIYDGWKCIDFVPTMKENDFLTYHKQYSGDKIVFARFVESRRWASFYGQYYFVAKALLGRLIEENQYCKNQIEAMKKKGIRLLPATRSPRFDFYDLGDKKESGKYKTIKVWSFEAEIDLPFNKSKYPKIIAHSSSLLRMYSRVKMLTKSIEKLKFLTRTVEFAFARLHDPCCLNSVDDIVYPSWIKNPQWQAGFRFPKTRKLWYRLKFNQRNVGEYSVSLRFRWIKKSQRVHADSY